MRYVCFAVVVIALCDLLLVVVVNSVVAGTITHSCLLVFL